MSMLNQNVPQPNKASRIDQAIEVVGSITRTLENSTQRIVMHARSLGYYEPPKDAQAAPTAVVTTLSDALDELARAVTRNSDALNLFD